MAKKNKQQTELQMLDMYDKLKEFLVNPANHLLIRRSNQDKYTGGVMIEEEACTCTC